MKKFTAILLIAVIALTSSGAFADEAGISGDILILRPLGFAALVGGTVIFVGTLPITGLLSIANRRTIPETAKALVVKPFDYTFKRPVGETIVRN